MRLLEDQLTSQQQLLASLGSQRPAVAGSNGAAPAPGTKLVKDEEVREFGADLYDFIQRTAKESVLPEVDRRFEHQLKPVAAQVAQTASAVSAQGQAVAKSAEERVLQQLAAEVPNWDVLDADPGFLAWLDQYDPYSGSKRGELLNQAYKRHDGPRVVAFFKGYLNENAAVTPTPTPAPAAPAPQVSLESLTAPGAPKAGTAGAQEGAGKRIWTRAEIKQHYREVQLGKFSKRLDDARRIEADIFAAQREGRIR
ncbi:MAG: hypothetical protein HC793_00730 [Aquincola sp.]|nr:hypothetical protein [Aquincola sp.]